MALAELDAAGRNESAAADDLRERLDAPWDAMSDADQDLSGRLSAALDVAASHHAGTGQ